MDFALAAPFGAIIGSFLNVVAYRLPRGESLAWPGSRCTSCGEAVRSYDNVPVVSWLVLRGRCRHCGDKISAQYPVVELLTALVFGAIVLVRGVRPELALELPFAALLIAVAFIDLEHRIVPNKLLLPAAGWAIGVGALVALPSLPEALIAGAAAFTFLLIAAVAHPAGMGMGDVKLAGVMGLYLGLSVVPALLVAFLAGSVVGVVLIASRGSAARKTGVPFAPFLAFGALVGLLAGPELIDLYTRNFL
ncbi:MAG: leader peptidase (prepilin peptidase) / N-methyltransferase [Thermoleophilaceae bacterium]|jgi:leader peptidase (prepilin peptidase)/N-methyltransferase|nr:leader peptidase (prepilin peptidase) / N-methyltransferase [Thermoleophilaceae bacterium]